MTIPRLFAVRLGLLSCSFVLTGAIFGQRSAGDGVYDHIASLIATGQFDPAVHLLHQVLEESPTNARAENLMGIALTGEGRLADADSYFEEAIKNHPTFYPALKNLALNELRLNDAHDARIHLEKVLLSAPQDPVAHFSLAEIDYSEKRYLSAAKHFERSQGLYLRAPGPLLDYATSCAKSGQDRKTVEAIRQLSQAANSAARFRAGMLLAQGSHYAEAAHQFAIAWNESPNTYQIGFNLTLAEIKSQRYLAAISTAQKMISRGQGTSEVYELLSEAYERSGKTVDAYNALRRATLIDPGNENSYLDLIALCVDHMNYDLALEIADIGLGHIPGSYRLLLERGAVHAMRGQYDDAARDIHVAATLEPGKDLPYFAESMALMESERMEESIQLLRRRVAANPNDYLILYALGEALNQSGPAPGRPEAKEAIRVLQRSIRLNPNFARSRAVLGTLLLAAGRVDDGISELQSALRLEPGDRTPAYALARAYRKKGNNQLAAKYLQDFEKFKSKERNQYRNRRLITVLRAAEQ